MNAKIKKTTVVVICYAYALLFVYASTSKFLDFENFGVQLGQSPLLSAFAPYIKWIVPSIEIVISILLMIPSTRHRALYWALTLMAMFTVYIYIILNYSSFVPCSCGGILEKMGWQEHLLFNMGFMILAVVAIIISGIDGQPKTGVINLTLKVLGSTAFAAICVTALFQYSEYIMHAKNNFIRRFPPYAVIKEGQYDLKYNSYYFAGSEGSHVYLGNSVAPSNILEFDTKPAIMRSAVIDLKGAEKIPFNSIQVKVVPPYFFVLDGLVPCVFRGKTSNWQGSIVMKGVQNFSVTEVIDSTTIALRTRSKLNGENVLGILDLKQKPSSKLSAELLQKQFDGIFDTDGTLRYSKLLNSLVYTYYYRNQFIVINRDLNLQYRGNTIDTTTRAKIKVAYLKSQNVRKFAAPPNTVNAKTAIYRNLLFVNSKLQGRYEHDYMWKKASVVDVYDIAKNRYSFSFYIEDSKGEKCKSFMVADSCVYALIGNELVSYKMGNAFFTDGKGPTQAGLKAARQK